MISLVEAKRVGPTTVHLAFSDESEGVFDFAEIVARKTPMTQPLTDPEFFGGFFVEAGALAWPNGLDFSGRTLRAKLKERGLLKEKVAA